jgi:hypothetical protein
MMNCPLIIILGAHFEVTVSINKHPMKLIQLEAFSGV